MTHKVPCMFQQIDDAISEIESVKVYLDNAFQALENKTQEQIDKIIVEDINPYINSKLSKIRNKLLSSLQQQYAAFQSESSALEPISMAEISANLEKLAKFCTAVKDFLVGAYTTLMEFTTQLTAHLVSLTAVITDICTYTPPISGISFSKLHIEVEPITMEDITG